MKDHWSAYCIPFRFAKLLKFEKPDRINTYCLLLVLLVPLVADILAHRWRHSHDEWKSWAECKISWVITVEGLTCIPNLSRIIEKKSYGKKDHNTWHSENTNCPFIMPTSSNNSLKLLSNSLMWSLKPSSKRRIEYKTTVGPHLNRKEDTLDPGSSAMSMQCELRKKIRRKYEGEETSDWETWKHLPENEFRHQLREKALNEEENQRKNFNLNCFNASFR